MTQKQRSQLIKKCDGLFSRLVRARGACEKCGTTLTLACSHIIPRQYMATRFDPDNAHCLCYRCHIHWWHKFPTEASAWLNHGWPGREARLNFKRQTVTKVDIQIVYLMLQRDLHQS